MEVIAGPHTGQRFELTGHETYTVGRQPGLHVTLPGDAGISRVHCTLAATAGVVRVTDHGSRSGVFVNGARVEQAVLNDGETVAVGSSVFRVRVPAPAQDATVTLGAGGTSPVLGLAGCPPVVPGYRVGDELGRGAMGVVYRAVQQSDGGTVAIKTILPAVAPSPLVVGRFCREAEILGRLTHPNVVGHRASGAAGPLLYVVMEYVPGEPGSAILAREGPLAPARVDSRRPGARARQRVRSPRRKAREPAGGPGGDR